MSGGPQLRPSSWSGVRAAAFRWAARLIRPPSALYAGLYSDDQPFPLEAGLRLEISRKFNDNITLAATYWGLQQWSVDNTIYPYPGVLASPYLQLPTFRHLAGLHLRQPNSNVEVNALFRLNPSDPYWEVDWLCGARYVYFTDHLHSDRGQQFERWHRTAR